VIALFAAVVALASLSLAVAVHRSLPREHARAADFPKLMTTGAYGYVRHPLYSLLIAFNYGVALTFLSIDAVLASTLLLPLWWYVAKAEEDQLMRLWGQEYVEYRKRVPMFLPITISML
jgi:protein-S-isoprenylcysteine O-methyltransferase Ste14